MRCQLHWTLYDRYDPSQPSYYFNIYQRDQNDVHGVGTASFENDVCTHEDRDQLDSFNNFLRQPDFVYRAGCTEDDCSQLQFLCQDINYSSRPGQNIPRSQGSCEWDDVYLSGEGIYHRDPAGNRGSILSGSHEDGRSEHVIPSPNQRSTSSRYALAGLGCRASATNDCEELSFYTCFTHYNDQRFFYSRIVPVLAQSGCNEL